MAISTFKNFSLVDGGTYAAALTYYFFFSIFPLLLFGASILGFLTQGNDALRDDILQAGLSSVPLLQDVLTDETLTTIENNKGSFALSGAALALYSGSGAIVALSHALNRIAGVTQERNFVGKRLRSLMWLGILGVGAVISLGLGAIAGYATNLFDGPVSQTMSWVLGHAVGFLVGILIFGSAFRYLPNLEQSWREVVPGAAVAAFMFEVLKEIGTWYLERGAAGRQETFGTLAAAAGLLVASYLIAQVILLSASLNDVLAQRRASRTSSIGKDKEDEGDG